MKHFGVTAALLPFAALLVIAGTFTVGWERPPIEVQQIGFRGTGMEQPINPRADAKLRALNQMPAEVYPLDSAADLAAAPKARDVYENVTVLGDLPEPQFTRLMAAITEWVAPEQGCGYCHNLENLADDSVYTKVVARRMIEMTWNVNANWQDHVKDTGVTCYTCHRGNPVPQNIWFDAEPQRFASKGMLGRKDGQNLPSDLSVASSLPTTWLSDYLVGDAGVRVQSTAALPTDAPGATIQSTEKTYGMMMHMADGLGVSCNYCHNTQSFQSWDKSPRPACPPGMASGWSANSTSTT